MGVKADELHYQFMLEHLKHNGLRESNYTANRAVIAPKAGVAVFPVHDESSGDCALRPIFFESEVGFEVVIYDKGSFVYYCELKIEKY